jgi:hypothetical protein
LNLTRLFMLGFGLLAAAMVAGSVYLVASAKQAATPANAAAAQPQNR